MAEVPINAILLWLLGTPNDMVAQFVRFWRVIKASLVVPILRFSLFICFVMSTMLFLEWVYLGAVVLYVKVFDKKPERRYKWEPVQEDFEAGNSKSPMVLVQIPLFNEKEVYKLSIGAACNLSWPSDRLLIQVLDGSTDIIIKNMIEKECNKWSSKGVNIIYQSRETKGGFKAGALKEGLAHDYVKECEHVAIFDADFQPEPDFLLRAMPYLIHNPDIALVQARWRFVNADDCLLTRLQEISLDYHFIAEQQAGSISFAFFAFNGSGGIWRVSAINECGGWDCRTTAEDMDLAVRAALKGWKFVLIQELEVKSELPSTLTSYRPQQYRWYCGPTALFRQTAIDIVTNKNISVYKKAYMIYSFFFVRKVIGQTCVFLSYCVVLPLTILIPEADIPKAGAVFVPWIMAAINCIFTTPRSLHLCIVWTLFMTTMSFHLVGAVFRGLFGTKSANQWVVTEKIGECANDRANGELNNPHPPQEPSCFKSLLQRILVAEVGMSVFLLMCGCYGVAYGKDYYLVYLFVQSLAFAIVGLGFIGRTCH